MLMMMKMVMMMMCWHIATVSSMASRHRCSHKICIQYKLLNSMLRPLYDGHLSRILAIYTCRPTVYNVLSHLSRIRVHHII